MTHPPFPLQRFLGVSWEAPDHDGGSKVTFYTLEVAQSAPCACSGSSCSSGAGPGRRQERPCEAALEGNSVQMNLAGDVHTAEIRDLQPGTDYFFRVAANNAQVVWRGYVSVEGGGAWWRA